MPKYSYIVKDKAGKSTKNIIEAYSKDAAVAKLQNQNYFVISIKELDVKGVAKKKGINGNLNEKK